MPAGPFAPRAPGITSVTVGSGAQSGEAAALRSTVRIAVPGGASTFWSWWRSITSAPSTHGAASSPTRLMSTAPTATVGAIAQRLRVGSKERVAGDEGVTVAY